MKKAINLLLIGITYLLLIPLIFPTIILGINSVITWLMNYAIKIFTCPLTLMELLIIKINKRWK